MWQFALRGVSLCGLLLAVMNVLVVAPGGADRERLANYTVNAEAHYDPLTTARASIGHTVNLEAIVPPQCYTKTAAVANPCWTCHTHPQAENYLVDWPLQEEYAFSDFALNNHWKNLFVDRSAAIAAIGDTDVLSYIRADNYTPLRAALKAYPDYPGYLPDLDFMQGFDAEGFARDGSGWRAIRYKPFLGTFWPTNGSTDDVMIRLPGAFQTDVDDRGSREIYKTNLAIVEAAITADPFTATKDLDREVEPLDETLVGVDLNGDEQLTRGVTRIRGLPMYYVGAARTVTVKRYLYPKGTEFLHTMRYLDLDNPTLLATRMKEVRYARKVMGKGVKSFVEKFH